MAMENDVALVSNSEEITSTVLNKKQIVVQMIDPESKEAIIQNAHICHAINMHLLVDARQYNCHLSTKNLTNFT